MGGSGALEDDAFDDVGDVFALVDGGFDDFEDFFPLDDLDGIFLFVEELGDERATEAIANRQLFDEEKDPVQIIKWKEIFEEELGDERATEAIAIVFVAVDLDAVLERRLRLFQRANGNLDLGGGRNQDLDEIEGSAADAIDAIEHKSAAEPSISSRSW